jgi:hypothetical protein
MKTPRRFWLKVALVFLVRTAYAGLVHGPLLLTPLVYARFPTAMNPTMNLPALLAVEALVSLLFVSAYAARFGSRRPSALGAAGLGLLFGVAVYVPQNLLNLILLAPVHVPLAAAWVGTGVTGCVFSGMTCWVVERRADAD